MSLIRGRERRYREGAKRLKLNGRRVPPTLPLSLFHFFSLITIFFAPPPSSSKYPEKKGAHWVFEGKQEDCNLREQVGHDESLDLLYVHVT